MSINFSTLPLSLSETNPPCLFVTGSGKSGLKSPMIKQQKLAEMPLRWKISNFRFLAYIVAVLRTPPHIPQYAATRGRTLHRLRLCCRAVLRAAAHSMVPRAAVLFVVYACAAAQSYVLPHTPWSRARQYSSSSSCAPWCHLRQNALSSLPVLPRSSLDCYKRVDNSMVGVSRSTAVVEVGRRRIVVESVVLQPSRRSEVVSRSSAVVENSREVQSLKSWTCCRTFLHTCTTAQVAHIFAQVALTAILIVLCCRAVYECAAYWESGFLFRRTVDRLPAYGYQLYRRTDNNYSSVKLISIRIKYVFIVPDASCRPRSVPCQIGRAHV